MRMLYKYCPKSRGSLHSEMDVLPGLSVPTATPATAPGLGRLLLPCPAQQRFRAPELPPAEPSQGYGNTQVLFSRCIYSFPMLLTEE